MSDDLSRYLVRPGKPVSLKDWDPDDTGDWRKEQAREALDELLPELNALQGLLYASQKHALLVILQGMDTSGKDGTIKHVMTAFNPQGVQVTGFKVPTAEELAHDFLWRVHRATPGRGMVGIFNRSHYEDVLVVRVENLVPHKVWERRYDDINAWEQLLTDAGVTIVKFFLYISKDEQRSRLEERLQDPKDHWKFNVSDLKARAKWDEYLEAYEDALSRCSTAAAPWYVVPANKKWYRNLVISKMLLETLQDLKMSWPPLAPEAEGIQIE